MARDAKPYIETNELAGALTAQELEIASAPERQALAELDEIKETLTAEQISFSEMIGAIKMAHLQEKFLNVSRVKMLAELKESKKYKGLMVSGPGKLSRRVTTWEEFCLSLGCGVSIIDESIRNLSALGEEFLEYSQRIGLGYRDLRKLRKLPEEDRLLVIQQVEVDAGDKEAIVSLIEDIMAKHSKEKESASKQIDDLKGDLDAKAKLIAAKNEKIDELATKLERKKEEPPLMETFRSIDDLHHETVAIVSRIQASLCARFNAVIEAHGDEGGAHALLLVAQSLGQIVSAARMVAADYEVLPAENPPSVFREAAGDDEREVWGQINAMLEEHNAAAGN